VVVAVPSSRLSKILRRAGKFLVPAPAYIG
jgi:hypothetical protein